MKILNEFGSVGKVSCGFPRVLGVRVAFPFYEVLLLSSSNSLVKDLFHLVFFFSFDYQRRWFRGFSSGDVRFFVGVEKRYVEDRVDG